MSSRDIVEPYGVYIDLAAEGTKDKSVLIKAMIDENGELEILECGDIDEQ